MKKFLVSILAVLYITTSSGAVVHLHYCMDKFIGWGLWQNSHPGTNDTCNNCGMKKSSQHKKCCKDEQKLLKIQKDQKTTETTYKLSQPVQAVLVANYNVDTPVFIFSSSHIFSATKAPPLTTLVKTYLLNCHFSI
jgi:hypothetical protein